MSCREPFKVRFKVLIHTTRFTVQYTILRGVVSGRRKRTDPLYFSIKCFIERYTFQEGICHIFSWDLGFIPLFFQYWQIARCYMSDQRVHRKRNKSLSMSSSSYHKHMCGEASWRDWIEPAFIWVSPQPQASRGTLRNATGTFKGEKKEKSFIRLESWGWSAIRPLQWRWKFILLSIITFTFPHLTFEVQGGNMKGKEGHFDKITHAINPYLWGHSNSVTVFYFFICLQIHMIYCI